MNEGLNDDGDNSKGRKKGIRAAMNEGLNDDGDNSKGRKESEQPTSNPSHRNALLYLAMALVKSPALK